MMAQVIRAGYETLLIEQREEDTVLESSVVELVSAGESEEVEFKSTLRVNLHTNQKDPRVELGVLKTLAGFLNTRGGRLVIGVADERWGSRSAACLAGIVGVIATSFLLDYPICAGRLTLYALFFQQLLLLEGIDWLRSAAGGRRALQALVVLTIAFLLASGGWTATRVLRRVVAVALLPRSSE